MAYAYLISRNFTATVESLKDGLVRNGFERQETKELINIVDAPQDDDLFSVQINFTYSTPEMPEMETIPDNLLRKSKVRRKTLRLPLKAHLLKNKLRFCKAHFKHRKERKPCTRLLPGCDCLAHCSLRHLPNKANCSMYRYFNSATEICGNNLRIRTFCRESGYCWINRLN